MQTSEYDDLCQSLAFICVDPEGLYLIALNKINIQPSVHLIGVGEVMRRIIAKAVLSIVKLVTVPILGAAGSLQLCEGQDASNEAAIYAMRGLRAI